MGVIALNREGYISVMADRSGKLCVPAVDILGWLVLLFEGLGVFGSTLVEESKTRKQGGYRLRMPKGMCWWHYTITAQNLRIPRVSAIG